MRHDIVFSFRGYNDIDHLVPVIYRLRKDHPDIAVKAVIHDLDRDYRDDFRVRYIRSLGVPVEHVGSYCGFDAGYLDEYFRTYAALRRASGRTLRSFWMWRRIVQPRRARLQKRMAEIEPGPFFARALGRNHGGALICDITDYPYYQRLGEFANRNGIATFALPHGVNVRACRRLDWDVAPKAPRKPLWHKIVVYPNHHIAANEIGSGRCTPEQVRVLGSTRFCEEWVEHLRRILPAVTLPPTGKQTLKIVIMMNKPKSVYQAEVDRIIEFLSRFPDTCIVIKPHTRSSGYAGKLPPNVHVVDTDIPSPNLIDWADVTLFPMSTIIFDGLRRDRPILFLKRVIPDRVFHETFINSWRIDFIEELRDHIWALIQDRHHRTYTPQERDCCLRELVEPAGADVLGNYVALLSKHLGD